MFRSLASYLSHQADLRHDSRIPDETRRFIAQVAAAERQMDSAIGPVETARRSLAAAYAEFSDAYASLRQMERMAAANPADGLIREEVARLRAQAVNSLDWLADKRLAMSVALRQAQSDAAEQAASAAGVAA